MSTQKKLLKKKLIIKKSTIAALNSFKKLKNLPEIKGGNKTVGMNCTKPPCTEHC